MSKDDAQSLDSLDLKLRLLGVKVGVGVEAGGGAKAQDPRKQSLCEHGFGRRHASEEYEYDYECEYDMYSSAPAGVGSELKREFDEHADADSGGGPDEADVEEDERTVVRHWQLHFHRV